MVKCHPGFVNLENQEKIENLLSNIQDCHQGIIIEYRKDIFCDELLHFSMRGPFEHDRGYGSDVSLELALIKSYMELVEREYILTTMEMKSSNGCSAHTNGTDSKKNSYYEIIERDSFLTGWLLQIGPKWMDASYAEKIVRKIGCVIPDGVEVKLGIISQIGRIYTVVGAVKGVGDSDFAEFGCAIDTKTSDNLMHAFQSVVWGACYYLTLINDRLLKNNKCYREISKDDVKQPKDHLEYYLNPKNFPEWYFSDSGRVLFPDLPVCDFVTGVPNFKTAIPSFVTFPSSKMYQDYYTGEVKEGDINYERLLKINGAKFEPNLEIHLLP